MPCCLVVIALAAPRIALFLVWLMTDYLSRAYETLWVPILGFFFLPTTTLAYAWAINTHGEVRGFPLAVVVLAALLDLGALGGGSQHKRRRKAA
jgi:hypothetical protein